ncbi:hypothetical protein [Marinitoga aeolica]|uniref:Periplasmic protein n=1 Tax=Marinitoga aeolica TaxID=2809031 RepID=A0ABY8PNF5_9BACT|nr:hypothetical protein [Marinitoga aeolica]WGS64177.1 hypothetical protein JRV97_07280 [Marinitoga aeolica]
MKFKIKLFQPYYLLFALTLLLIAVIIIVNYNSNYSFDPDYVKNLPWNKRSSYIRQKEILTKLEHKKSYTDKDLLLINQLISISFALEDIDTLEYAQKLKYEYLITSFKQLSNEKKFEDFIDKLNFKNKLGLYLLSDNEKFLIKLIRKSSRTEKLQILFILNLFYPEKLKKVSYLFSKKDIEDVRLIVEYLKLKGE